MAADFQDKKKKLLVKIDYWSCSPSSNMLGLSTDVNDGMRSLDRLLDSFCGAITEIFPGNNFEASLASR